MPSKASTPRTTRNSRGLRRSPSVSSADESDSSVIASRVTKRRRRNTPTQQTGPAPPTDDDSSDLAKTNPQPLGYIEPPPATPPNLPTIVEDATPVTPAPQDIAIPAPLPAATEPETNLLEGPPPATPPPATPPPATPPPATPLQAASVPATPLQAALPLATPPQAASGPATPLQPASVPATPLQAAPLPAAPLPATPLQAESSPGNETRRFKERSAKEGEAFARELYTAIRNEQFMRGCICGGPTIYNCKEDADSGFGHLRFYVVDPERYNLRVIQHKHDLLWYCNCGHDKYISVYNGIINSNGKRPAQDSELDLIAQNAEGERSDTVERVVRSPSEADEQAHAQPLEPSTQSMWPSVTRCVATMGNSVFGFLGKIRDIFRGDAHDAVDTRSYNAINAKVVVKRFKRQACLPVEPSLATEPTVDINDLPYIAWTNDPAKYIGRTQLMRIQDAFERQMKTIKRGLICGGPTLDDVRAGHRENEDLELSIAIHQLGQQEFGEAESEEDSADIFESAVEAYYHGLSSILEFITKIYTQEVFSDIKSLYPDPPREVAICNPSFRMSCKDGADFLNFLLTLKELYKIDETFEEAITKILVDVNAVHKSDLLPSWVEWAGKESAMPGTFPTASVFDDIPVGQVAIEPRHALRFPLSESPTKTAPPVRVRDFKAMARPKGILKKSKEWPSSPSSPRYVSTPEKKRKLAFQNPVSKFSVPDKIPVKIMPIADAIAMETRQAWSDAHRNGSVRVNEHDVLVPAPKPHQEPDPWDQQHVEKDDREMGLQYHSGKYGTFLGDMRRDLQQRWPGQRESEPESEPEPQTLERNSPGSHQAVSHPTTPYRAKAQEHKSPRLSSIKSSHHQRDSLTAKTAQVQNQPQTPEERRRAMDIFLQNSEVEGQDEPRAPRELGPMDDLYIATKKLEDLDIARQIREEFEVAVQREADERRQRELEEEARRKEEEERQRLEQERRREEARQQAELARKEQERKREQEAKRQREAEQYAALTGLRAPTRPIILPISNDWDSRVDAIQSAAEATELTKTPDGQTLTRRDFVSKLLPEKAWLNDNIIIGSILHIANYVNQAAGAPVKNPKCVAFTSFFWPRLESAGPTKVGRLMKNANVRKDNFLEIDTILIPICKGSHWTLAIVRPTRRTVAHIDSMKSGAGDESIKAQLLEWVKLSLEEKFIEDEWSAFDYKAPRQTNGWDCGVFTITNAACIAMGLDPNLSYTARQLTEQRRRLAAVLLNKGFTGDLSLDGL
ncbi:hypothetical protein B0T22DRAFT_384545 [Podospora appendiculata]|uniref:Ubiquitin-like protease family profile domain-containing protein n=1 Tax=Podospora appendiculata TaxID=314037 RepID=A0AAE0X385_9PEZI|nr:hypothetical protein B0T22DRAFT_384545 [Podospora appendiculata]